MTLIAAFRCDGGAVICADSMESFGDFYVHVDKIGRLDLGAYEAVIGGSGYEGGLIDGLTDVLADSIQAWAAGLSESTLKNNLRYVISEYYANQVRHHPADDDAKRMEFVICIKGKDSEEVYLWRTESTTLYPIKDFALIGYNTPIYEYEAGRLYGRKGRPWLTRGVALGIHLSTLAKSTCSWVGGSTRVVLARDNGIHEYQPEDVDVLEERARQFNEALAELTLVLPDVSVAEGSFIEALGSFEEKVRALRGYYTQRAAVTLVERALNDPNYQGEPVPHVPLGTLIDVTEDGKARIMSAEETRAYILGAANPLTPDESELEEQNPPSNSEMSVNQSRPYNAEDP